MHGEAVAPTHLAARRCRFAVESNGVADAIPLSARRRTLWAVKLPAGRAVAFAINGCIYGIGVLWVVVLVRLSCVPFLILRSV